MGWTTYIATEYKNGKVDRKAECDKLFNWSSENRSVSVRKSSIVGSTYYAAIRSINKEKKIDETFAVVCLTCGKSSDGMNFGYKDMDETEIPYRYDCPKSILDLLTPTDNENANEWRRLCREKAEQKRKGNPLAKLPIGTKIRVTRRHDGKKIDLIKMAPNRQFKTYWFKYANENIYMPKSRVPKEFEIIQ